MMKIYLKRIYENAEESDGCRILVDRLWPRGVKKENAHLDLWLKEIAPSNELRKWFNHEPEKWEAFSRKYIEEIEANPSAVRQLQQAIEGKSKTTLLYGAKDETHNQAVVLSNWLSAKGY